MLSLLSDPGTYVMLATLAGLEIVLGIDNIVFITILCGRLPASKQHLARRLGLGLALISRLGLLFTLSWIMGLTRPWFSLSDHAFSGRDLILLAGGLFLLGKATHEIFHEVEHPATDPTSTSEPAAPPAPTGAAAVRTTAGNFASILLQIMVLDLVFSLDSVITAVGMVPHVSIMAAAMVIAVIIMIIFAGPVGDFVQAHASIRILALAFLVLVGVLLLAESFGNHVPRGYVYFSMGFALLIELINMRRKARMVRLWTVEKATLVKLQAAAKRRERVLRGYERIE